MRIGKILLNIALTAAVLMPAMLKAQSSSINTFSPYTLYGIGDLYSQGPTEIKSMGGAGVAFYSPLVINSLNPASYGRFGQRTFLFNFSLDGGGHYLSSKGSDGVTRRNSFNSFNLSNISLGFPITKGFGFSISLSPYSNVGYKIERRETDENITGTIGQVKYTHIGEGGINRVKGGLGWAITKDLSIGAEMIYYKGRISRMYNVAITPTLNQASYYSVTSVNYSDISKFYFQAGAQWNAISTQKELLTFGATYQMGGPLKADNYRYIPSNNVQNDTVDLVMLPSTLEMPTVLKAGVNYSTRKLSVVADYTFSGWGTNKQSEYSYIKYVNTNGISVGAQYVPNPGDVRRVMNRWSYRAGMRYEDHYFKMHNVNLSDKAVTFGVGIPLGRSGLSSGNIGFEVGQRGSLKNNLVKESYFRISIGLSLFGEDYWFRRFKYD